MPVLLLSGGIDSATLLWDIASLYESVYILSFNYGQRHSKELDHAKMIVKAAKERFENCMIYHKIVDISSIIDLISSGALTGNIEVPRGLYTDENQKITVVPNRNMILISIAAGYAVKLKEKEVYYAAHLSDYAIYPDCRKEFVKAVDTAVYLANLFNPVEVKAPFVDMRKADIVSLGLKLKVPYEFTWSCYEGGDEPCLECGACLERTEAFYLNNSKDPALSEDMWNKAVRIYRSYKLI